MSVNDLGEIRAMLGVSQQAMGVITLKIWEMACNMLCSFFNIVSIPEVDYCTSL